MSLEIGSRFGYYEITARLGAGGMGEVFRATDSNLRREVAIKVLSDPFTGDAERLARFEREAHLLASLNHPSIASIYGLEKSGDVRCLVLELVEGETLSGRLERGPLPADEALRIALHTADALEAAHEKGIIHRDLKPANIKVTPAGAVKVLDFGLAKVLEADAAGGSPDMSLSPTLTTAATRAGVIMGTAAYMSPEQAKGRPVDRRADSWAFGVVLFEMLTGAALHRGETVSDTLASVLKVDPPWDSLPVDLPAGVRRLLRRCLERDPRRRLRDIGEARIALDDLISGRALEVEPEGKAATAPDRRGRRVLLAVAAALVAAAVAAWATLSFRPPAEPVLRKFAVPAQELSGRNFAISPDGTSIAYASGDRLWIRRLDKLEPREISGAEDPVHPFWSPDSAWVGYFSGNRIMKVAIAGGEAIKVSDLPGALVRGAGASWSEDGRIVFAYGGGAVYEVPARGGDVKTVVEADASLDEDHLHEPCHLPGGSGLLFAVHRKQNLGTDTLAVVSGNVRRILVQQEGQEIWHPVYSSTGHILYRRRPANAGIWALPFDVSTLEATGEPFPVVPNGTFPSVSANGILTYAYGGDLGLQQLVWVSRKGEVEGTIGQPQPGLVFPSLSPDGTRVAVTAHENENWDVWIHDVTRATKTRLTFGTGGEWSPSWSPSGDRVAYSANDVLETRSADGTGEGTRLTDGQDAGFTPDGKTVVYEKGGDETGDDLWRVPADGSGEPAVFLKTEADEWAPRVSPDGGYLAYASEESGRTEVYVKRFPGGDGKWQVSVEGGNFPIWSRAGDELIYRQDDLLMAVPVETKPVFKLGTPVRLFEARESRLSLRPRGYDVSPDGQRFIGVQNLEQKADEASIIVVLNWFEEFKSQE